MDITSTLIAAAVLLVSAVLLIAVRGRAVRDIAVSAQSAVLTGSMPVVETDPPNPDAALAAAEAVGSAMIEAGYSVETVQDVLTDIARVNGLPESEVLVFPNAVLVSARGAGHNRTGAVTAGQGQMLFGQIDEIQRTVDGARTGVLDPASIVERISRVRAMSPIYGAVLRALAYALLSGALSVLLGATWIGVALSAALGLAVGAGLLVSERVPKRYGALITVATALLVAIVVFLLLKSGWGSGIMAALIAPLVVLLPGALLTTAVLELSMGHMISGAGRAAAGMMQLVLLGAGIVAAGAIVGIPDFDFTERPELLGPVAPWVAVAVFGVAIAVHRCAPLRDIPWMLLVLYIAYSAQVLVDPLVGGIVAAFVGALIVTPVTALVARQPSGPAALVTFTPAFWLLVPGALGLVSVADALGGDSAGAATLIAAVSTMVAIALGVLAGSSLSNRMRRPAL